MEMEMDDSINVFDEPLNSCGGEPVTGFFRDSKCNTCEEDVGSHTVCIQASKEFLKPALEYIKTRMTYLMFFLVLGLPLFLLQKVL